MIQTTRRTDHALLRKIALLSIVALLVLKVVGVVMRGPSPIVLDAAEYWELAGRVADGDWLLTGAPIAYRTPGYPWFVGLFRMLSDQPLFALVCSQAVLWIATIGLTAWMAVDLSGNRRAGWVILAISTLMVSAVTYVSAILTETVFVFLIVFHLWAVIRYAKRPSAVLGLMVGLSLGLAILVRPIAMLIWIADGIYLFASWYGIGWRCDNEICRKRGMAGVLVACLATAAVITPWIIRNQSMFGKPMLTEFLGRNIWIVTFQDGSGAGLDFPRSDNAGELVASIDEREWSEMQSDQSWRLTWTVSDALVSSGIDDASTDRLMRAVASDAIANAPDVFGRKTVRRLINFWRTRATDLPLQVADLAPERDARENLDRVALYQGQPLWGVKVAPVDTALRYRWSNWLTGNTILMLLTLAATILLIYRVETRAAGLLIAAVLGYFSTVTGVLEIPDYRYRMIIEPIVLLSIAVAFDPFLSLFAPSRKDIPSE